MNCKNLFIILLFLCPFVASAQNELTGRVTNDKGAILPGASVYIEDLKFGSVADQNGVFTISYLPKGTFLVTVRYIGYENKSELIKVKSLTMHDFSLKPANYSQPEVVVTGN